ncbi:MAG: prepilin-type N-terminal cleavage/methylation domain-containing protein [Gemmatimonadota bacterium]|nr:prepilin-type N-terminal cleavage/methylation domain-containing protein [Gemmatimonadota bacterium]
MNGYSLFELTVALALLAVASSVLTPALAGYRDRMTVLAARETVVGLLHETRAAARRVGAASLQVDAERARVRVAIGDSVIRAVDLGGQGVRIDLPRGRVRGEIAYNGLGIGVFANETVEFSAGSERARLVVSSYGRVRRD